MDMRRNVMGILLVGVALFGVGCVGVGRHWTEPVSQRLSLDTSGLKQIEVKTHNGSVQYHASPDEAYVNVTKKASGRSRDDASAALEALEVFVEPDGAGTQRIGYRWRGIKSTAWGASVSFDIHAPSGVNLSGETHNGRVTVAGLSGDLTFETHNGAINATTTGGKLHVKTHNGGIEARCAGRDVRLVTHNGPISADLTGCQTVGGRIETHNGGVEIRVADTTSLELDAQTHNGGIRCTVPMQLVETTKRRLTASLGDGGERLAVRTHNGSVRVVP